MSDKKPVKEKTVKKDKKVVDTKQAAAFIPTNLHWRNNIRTR